VPDPPLQAHDDRLLVRGDLAEHPRRLVDTGDATGHSGDGRGHIGRADLEGVFLHLAESGAEPITDAIGVRSSCDTSETKSARRADSRRSSSTVLCIDTRRRACHTIARNIADIKGTSHNSPQSCVPSKASLRISAPVVAATAASTIDVVRRPQTRKP